MTDPEDQNTLPPLGDRGRIYSDAFLAQVSLTSEIGGGEATTEQAAELRRAELLMNLAARNGGAREDFAAIAGFVPDDPHATTRADLQALRQDPDLVVLYPDIDAELASYPVPPTYDPQTRDMAAFLLRMSRGERVFVATSITDIAEFDDVAVAPVSAVASEKHQGKEPVEKPAAPAVGNVADTRPEQRENNRQPLSVTVYRGDSMLVFNGTEQVALSRTLGNTKRDVTEEAEVERARLAALEILAAHPDKVFYTGQLYELVFPGQKFAGRASSTWDHYVGKFLEDTLLYRGNPIVRVERPLPRRKTYQLGEFAPTFSYEEGVSGAEQDAAFKLSDGSLLGGMGGRVLHRLVKANAESPFGIQELHEMLSATDDISAEERARMVGSRATLSGIVSSIRSALRQREIDPAYRIHVADDPRDTKSSESKKSKQYWVETLPYDAERQAELNEAFRAAGFIADRSELLEALELPRLDVTISTGLAKVVPFHLRKKFSLADETAEGTLKLLELCRDGAYIEMQMNLPGDHPLLPLVSYLFEQTEQDESLFTVALTAQLTKQRNTDKGIEMTYDVPGRGEITVIRTGQMPPDDDGSPKATSAAKSSKNEKTAADKAKKAAEAEKKADEELRAIVGDTVMDTVQKCVRDVETQLADAGLTGQAKFNIFQVRQTFSGLSMDDIKEYIHIAYGRSDVHDLMPSDIATIYSLKHKPTRRAIAKHHDVVARYASTQLMNLTLDGEGVA